MITNQLTINHLYDDMSASLPSHAMQSTIPINDTQIRRLNNPVPPTYGWYLDYNKADNTTKCHHSRSYPQTKPHYHPPILGYT